MNETSVLEHVVMETILGPLTVSGDHSTVHSIEFGDFGGAREAEYAPESPAVADTVYQLRCYFKGELFSFTVPQHVSGTEFQRNVWGVMQTIAYGEVITYGDIAKRLGNAYLSRAVGQAANRNPLPIIVPCHRVVGANGAMGGFAPGVKLKEILLKHEQACAVRKK